MRLSYFTLESIPALPLTGADVTLVPSLPPAPDQKSIIAFLDREQCDGLVFQLNPATDSSRIALQLIEQLRATPEIQLTPVFCYGPGPIDVRLAALVDGSVTSLGELRVSVERIAARSSEIQNNSFEASTDYRILAHLHTRNGYLEPVQNPSAQRYYSYPLAEVIGDKDKDINVWLEHLERRGLIRTARLVDRVRACPSCDRAQLNYVDVCPDCASVDIAKVPFLHCFTCGHIAPQEDFVIGGGLTCQNCRSRLRHIGADYDRPLENYHCASCRSSFIEPNVIARCMYCNTVSSPEELISYSIAAYELAERGTLSVRSGTLEDIYSLLDNLNYVHPTFFNLQIEWLLQLCLRYPEDAFSLIGLRLTNILELSATAGRQQASQLVDTYAARLRELVRSTDMSTRSSRHTLWLLLPKTSEKGCAVLHSRIRRLEEATEQADGSRLRCASVTFTASRDSLKDDARETAELLLARLENELFSIG